MSNVKFNSSSIADMRLNAVRNAKVSLVEEHSAKDEKIQNYIRDEYSLSEEIAILRKEVKELKEAFKELLQIETLDSANSEEFETYNAYVEECKSKVKEERGFETSTEASE